MTHAQVGYFQSFPALKIGQSPADVHFPPLLSSIASNGVREPCGYLPRNLLAGLFGKNMFPQVGGGIGYNANLWTVTTTGTGAAVADASTPGGGVLMTCGSDSTFNTNLQSKQAWTPVAGKRGVILARCISSSITAVGFELNFGSSAVDPATTNYTDVIGLKQAVGGATIIGKVRGDSGTESDTASLGSVTAATEFFVGLDFMLSATNTSVVGGFFFGTSILSYSYTAFSAAQQTQAAAILTTPPSMFLNLSAKGSAGNPTITFPSVIACLDS